MAALPILWLLVAPFCTASVVGRTRWGNALVARCYWPCIALGWIGVGLIVTAGLVLKGDAALLALLVGAPLAGLSFWTRRDGGGGGGEPPAEDPEPSGPEWDWEAFYADLREFTDARGRRSEREREPALV